MSAHLQTSHELQSCQRTHLLELGLRAVSVSTLQELISRQFTHVVTLSRGILDYRMKAQESRSGRFHPVILIVFWGRGREEPLERSTRRLSGNVSALTVITLNLKVSVCKVRTQDPENFGWRGQVFGICLAFTSFCFTGQVLNLGILQPLILCVFLLVPKVLFQHGILITDLAFSIIWQLIGIIIFFLLFPFSFIHFFYFFSSITWMSPELESVKAHHQVT